MSERLSKESILRACMIKQQLQIDDFQKEIKSLKAEIFDHEESPSQGNSSAAERTEVLQRYEGELEFLKNELKTLESLDLEKEYTQVLPGAVVETNQRIFFISVSIEQVEVNGSDIFGLSIKAPIYGALRGKVKGDKFDFNGVDYEIIAIY